MKSNRANSSSNSFGECNSANSLSGRVVGLGNPVHFSVVRVGSNRASSPKIVSLHANSMNFFFN